MRSRCCSAEIVSYQDGWERFSHCVRCWAIVFWDSPRDNVKHDNTK